MNPIKIIIIIIILAAAVLGVLYVYKNAPPPDKTLPLSPKIEPAFTEGTFVAGTGERTIIQSLKPLEVALQNLPEKKTVAVSWDESQASIYHIVLLNKELQVSWLVSSLKSGFLLEKGVQKENVSFIPAGYVLGDRPQGFYAFEEPKQLQLISGEQYYLQLLGFTAKGENAMLNTKFVFQ